MKGLDVYQHFNLGFVAIKSGFSWPAFFFGWMWAFFKGLWGSGFAYLGIMGVLAYLEVIFQQEESKLGVFFILLFQLGVLLWFGIKGNEFIANRLIKRDYQPVGRCTAASPEEAVDKTMDAAENPRGQTVTYHATSPGHPYGMLPGAEGAWR